MDLLMDMDVSKNSGTQNGWFMMKNPVKIDDLGVPLFLETPIYPENCNISLSLPILKYYNFGRFCRISKLLKNKLLFFFGEVRF